MSINEFIRRELRWLFENADYERDLCNEITQEDIVVAASDETTDLTTGTGKVKFRLPDGLQITSVRASVGTAPVGSTIIIDVKKNGVSIFTTLLSIDASEKTSVTAAVPSVLNAALITCADDDEIAIDITQVGSSTAGKGLKVTIKGHR